MAFRVQKLRFAYKYLVVNLQNCVSNYKVASRLATQPSGVIPNAIHGLATFLTLFLLGKPMMEKLNRMKMKYGMMETEDEV